jgi:hypothetical protein
MNEEDVRTTKGSSFLKLEEFTAVKVIESSG